MAARALSWIVIVVEGGGRRGAGDGGSSGWRATKDSTDSAALPIGRPFIPS